MSESLDFIKGFQDLLEDNRAEEAKANLLKSEVVELEKEIEELKSKRLKLMDQIKQDKDKAFGEIKAQQDNFAYIREQETKRMSDLSDSLDSRLRLTAEEEAKIKQRSVELLAKSDQLDAWQRDLTNLRDDLVLQHGRISAIKETVELDSMRLRSEWNSLAKEKENIQKSISDINENLHNLKLSTEELRAKQKTVEDKEKELALKENELNGRVVLLEKNEIALANKEKQFTTQIILLDKKKKDLDDKEKAINAMKVELDFKIAKLKKAQK